MFVNDIDSLIDDFEAYVEKFKEITHRELHHDEWVQIKEYLASRYKIKPPIVEWEAFKRFSDKFDEVHLYLIEHVHVPMLIRAIWAEHVGILTTQELDEVNRKWRTAR